MSNLLDRARSWMQDPFNRQPVIQRHTKILREIHETTKITSDTLRNYESFPVSRMVGNSKMRGRQNDERIRIFDNE